MSAATPWALVASGLMLLVANGADGGAAGTGQERDAPNRSQPSTDQHAPAATPGPPPASREASGSDTVTVIAEGLSSAVAEAFVAVVRDVETYGALRDVLGGLPERRADSFKTHTIVAAFLGSRPTGGYGVRVTRSADGVVRLAESPPPTGTRVTEGPTAPFTVAAVPWRGLTPLQQTPLRLEVDEAWKKAMRRYQVKDGEFASSGGIAGRTETFRLEGEVGLVRLGRLITVALDLSSVGSAGPRRLRSFATGVTDGSGGFHVPRLDGGGLVGWPNGGLRARGRLTPDATGLSLAFEPVPSDIADGFEGRGKVEAIAAGTKVPPP